MGISSDPNRRRAAASGHIQGVPFVDTPEAKSMDSDPSPDNVDTEWFNLSMKNLHAQVKKARHEASLSFAIALASVALDIIIIANHFTH